MSLALMFAALALLIALEMPVAFALALASVIYLQVEPSVPMTIVVQRMASGLDSFPFLALPLFILTGNLLNSAGIAHRIFTFALCLVGHIRGSLAHVNVVASMIFAGMSGVAQADAAGLGAIEVRAMRRIGFSGEFSAAVSASSAMIGPLIPPSVIMVIYGVLAQVSVADLFIAGIGPGVLVGAVLMGMIYVMARMGTIPSLTQPKPTLPALTIAFWRALPALLAPVLLIGGLFLGIATPTELGAITVVYAIALGFAYRELTLASLFEAFRDSFLTYGILVFIIASAVPFGWVISVNNLATGLAEFLTSLTDQKWLILLMVNLILLIAGCFLETTAILMIAVPALLPLMNLLQVDLVHFGLFLVFNLLIGGLTPPFGVLLFVMVEVAQVRFWPLVRAMLPFYPVLIGALILITYWPAFTLYLPSLLRD
jgi:tripartite ATP-independent transporter DctM subunit